LKILGGRLVIDGRSEAIWRIVWMMLDRENNEHSEDSASMQKSMMLSGERQKRTIFGSVCSDSFDDLRE
jgi:hypothetical protein